MKKKSITKKLNLEKLKITKLSNGITIRGGSEYCIHVVGPIELPSEVLSCTLTKTNLGGNGQTNRPSQNCAYENFG
ncbi:hypothetical protein [Aquimarina sp. MAR_2010_214]|uniref:hypothetical protein n=1 Tax=Aquimarina sp. MAR_2010_214 TaxID=1250026 RepID=UPI0011779FEE|nr:hypothetical protein [Aquimarina sp. MAR_2010_214]